MIFLKWKWTFIHFVKLPAIYTFEHIIRYVFILFAKVKDESKKGSMWADYPPVCVWMPEVGSVIP